jgi:hypothetical protein
MNARIPDFPPSLGATLAILAGLAFVLSHGGQQVAGAREAAKARDEVRAKAKRLVEEMARAVAERDDTLKWADTSGKPRAPAEITTQVEELHAGLDRMQVAFRRIQQGGQLLRRALHAAKPHTPILERMHPGWGETTSKVADALAQFQAELERIDASVASYRGPIEEVLLRSLAEQGLRAWAEQLPQDDEPLFDEADAQPIRWDEDRGWVEGDT